MSLISPVQMLSSTRNKKGREKKLHELGSFFCNVSTKMRKKRGRWKR